MKPELIHLMREYQAAHEWKKKCLAARDAIDAEHAALSKRIYECKNVLTDAREKKSKAFAALVAHLDAGGDDYDED